MEREKEREKCQEPLLHFETTEIVEDFDLTGGQLVDEAAYDASGNLTFTGSQRLTYDASNRLVQVQNAYRDSGGAVVAGSTIAAYHYDANNRMIVEEQHTADGLDRIEHHYYLGHSLIETRDNASAPEPADAGRVLSQSIWDSLVPGQYVDALAQVAHNLDPGVDHDPATPEVEDLVDTRLYALQDVSGGYNILGLVNARGDLVERREYDLYGRMTVYHPAGLDFGEFAGADISGDGVIDLGDLVILSNSFGNASSSHADGDMNGDGVVDLGDLVILSNKFGDVFRSANDPLVTAPSGGASGRLGFGLAQAGQSLCDFGFQGLRHLRGTSFVDNRARVYDRHAGRFVQRDPWMQDEESGISQAGDGYPDGMNSYAAYHVMHGGVDPFGTIAGFTDCTQPQQAAITAADVTITNSAADAVTELRANFNWTAADKKYGFSGRARAILAHRKFTSWYDKTESVLVEMDGGIRAGTWGAECECECDPGTIAYVRPGFLAIGIDDDIHFCPAFFRLGAASQARVLFHEISHYYAGTEDRGLGITITNRSDNWAHFPDDAHWIDDIQSGGGNKAAAARVFHRFLNGAVGFY